MWARTKMKQRSRLNDRELEIFQLVREHATDQQWRRWLQIPLEHAAAKGDIDLFTALTDAGADTGGDCCFLGLHGRTLIGAAAAHGKSEEIVVALLKEGGVDGVDVRLGRKRESALHVAALYGVEDLSNALILAGANPSVLDREKQSPLHLAAEEGHEGVVTTLLKHGADPNARSTENCKEMAPLHLAAAEGHALCVSKLMVGGADKDSRNLEGKTPLHLAAQNNRLGAVEALLAAGAKLDIRDRYYRRFAALDVAAKGGYVDVVRALLEHGSRVNASDALDGYTALHHAAGGSEPPVDNGETIRDMLDVGAAIFIAPRVDNGEVIRMLLEAGADIDAKDIHDGCTPLHMAAVKNLSVNNVHALLEGGANVNARSVDGYTPLHHACYRSYVGAVELLLRWGADEKLTNDRGETAEGTLGTWEGRYDLGSYKAKRLVDDQRIRYKLARAPADRSWRRRGWLVLARSYPAKVQLTKDASREGGGNDSCKDGRVRGDGAGSETRTDLERLVGRVVRLDEEGVFRSVVGFL